MSICVFNEIQHLVRNPSVIYVEAFRMKTKLNPGECLLVLGPFHEWLLVDRNTMIKNVGLLTNRGEANM